MNASLVVSLLLGLLDRASAIGGLLQKARNEGRDVSDAELDALVAADDSAKKSLEELIAKARGG